MFAGGFVAYSFERCSDGLSNTFLLGETLVGHNPHRSYFDCSLNCASTNPTPNFGLKYLDECPYANPSWDYCNMQTEGFDSMHPGGVQMATADGTSKFVAETIDYNIWNYLGDRGTDSFQPCRSNLRMTERCDSLLEGEI